MKRDLDVLTDGTFDLLILGGGITGTGVALDAVLRGYRVALIDKGDFASGTSSVSSKLVHGGLRYLEHRDFGLVYEALHERRLLLRNAPHLVRPLRFLIPFYQPSRVACWKLRLGLTLYDLLSGAGNLRRSRPLRVCELLRETPDLSAKGLHGGAAYFDAQMDDARLCLEVLHTATVHGAAVANYVELRAFEKQGHCIIGVHAVDRIRDRELVIRARQILNATGPWVDEVRRLAGETGRPQLSPTKGVHVVTPGRDLRSAFLLFHPDDGRVFFVIPWMGKTLIGTTDTRTDEAPDALTITSEEIDYLLRGFNHHFTVPLDAKDVISSFAGLRPLIHARPGEPSAQTREFRLSWSPSGLLSAAGGKYTTYRHMAEIITNEVERRLGKRHPCQTRDCPLIGTPAKPWTEFAPEEAARLATSHGLSAGSARHLVDRYGTQAGAAASVLKRDAQLAQLVVPGEPDLQLEFVYQREQEMAILPEDYLLRRTRLGLLAPGLRLAPPPGLSEAAAKR